MQISDRGFLILACTSAMTYNADHPAVEGAAYCPHRNTEPVNWIEQR